VCYQMSVSDLPPIPEIGVRSVTHIICGVTGLLAHAPRDNPGSISIGRNLSRECQSHPGATATTRQVVGVRLPRSQRG